MLTSLGMPLACPMIARAASVAAALLSSSLLGERCGSPAHHGSDLARLQATEDELKRDDAYHLPAAYDQRDGVRQNERYDVLTKRFRCLLHQARQSPACNARQPSWLVALQSVLTYPLRHHNCMC